MIRFEGRHFPKYMILMAVRQKVSYPLSQRNIEELLEERGAEVDHSTIQKWVVHYAPKLEDSFRKRKNPVGKIWKMDQTYILVSGRWCYLYRAVDQDGNTVDFMLSERRDRAAALKFFIKAMGSSGIPEKINIDKSGSNKAALELINTLLFPLWSLAFTDRNKTYQISQ